MNYNQQKLIDLAAFYPSIAELSTVTKLSPERIENILYKRCQRADNKVNSDNLLCDDYSTHVNCRTSFGPLSSEQSKQFELQYNRLLKKIQPFINNKIDARGCDIVDRLHNQLLKQMQSDCIIDDRYVMKKVYEEEKKNNRRKKHTRNFNNGEIDDDMIEMLLQKYNDKM